MKRVRDENAEQSANEEESKLKRQKLPEVIELTCVYLPGNWCKTALLYAHPTTNRITEDMVPGMFCTSYTQAPGQMNAMKALSRGYVENCTPLGPNLTKLMLSFLPFECLQLFAVATREPAALHVSIRLRHILDGIKSEPLDKTRNIHIVSDDAFVTAHGKTELQSLYNKLRERHSQSTANAGIYWDMRESLLKSSDAELNPAYLTYRAMCVDMDKFS
jgi:hypothetical protein